MLRRVLCLLPVFALLIAPASAAAPYRGYTYNAWGEAVAAPIGYTPATIHSGADIGCGPLDSPSDIALDGDGSFYIADTGNDRIVVADREFSLLRVIECGLNSPTGVFAAADGSVYIADAENNRVVKCDAYGNVEKEYFRPQSELIPASLSFKPHKVLCDYNGDVYVLVQGFYMGAFCFDKDGEFQGFFANNTVPITARLLTDRLFQAFMTDEQKSRMTRNIPSDFSNFTIDGDGFIYTCSSARITEGPYGKLKKINYAGINIYRSAKSVAWGNGNFGDIWAYWYRGTLIQTSFCDIAVDDDGFVYGLDATRGRVFQYDSASNLTFVFGGIGDRAGCFTSPSAIAVSGSNVYVLDSGNGTITKFIPTEYGAMARQAAVLYNDGMYVESIGLWQEVLRSCANCELAYVGLGKAYLQLDRYNEALENFEKGNDVVGRSVAFEGYRSRWISDNIWMLPVLAIAVAAIIVLRGVRRRRAQ